VSQPQLPVRFCGHVGDPDAWKCRACECRSNRQGGSFDWRPAAILATVFLLPFIISLPFVGCSGAMEQRKSCTIAIHDHPKLPRPAGRIKVRCDGVDRATIDAKRVHVP